MTGAAAGREMGLRANELYWGSDRSVNQIAEELDLSKGVLYSLIRPRPSGLACPACRQELVYPNRTAHERRAVACPACGWQGDQRDVDPIGAEGSVVLSYEGLGDEEVFVPPIKLSTARQRAILGGVLLGAAAGLALVLWARRRR